VKGKHIASLATGQLLLAPPDIEHFKRQAEKHGFDEKAYLAALDEIPVVAPDKLRSITRVLGEMAQVISDMGYATLAGKEKSEALSKEIDERRRAETALEAETANLDAVFESSPVGMFILDETTNIVRANAAFVVLCGASRSRVLHHRPGNALGCIHSAKDPRGCGYAPDCPLCPARRGIEDLIANGGTLRGAELPLQLVRDGESCEVWVEIGAEPVLLNGRRHLCVAMSDITERKQTEVALRIKDAFFEGGLAAHSTADASGTINLVNDAFVDLWGYESKEQALGNSVADFFVNPEDAKPVLEALNGTGVWQGEFLAKRQNGQPFVSAAYASAIRDEKGELIGYQSTNVDMTPLREAERHREESLARTQHLNRILAAIRNVNQLIVHENDPARLIQQTCELLIETRGYNGAWIALGDQQGSPTLHSQAGWGHRFEPVARKLTGGCWPDCHDQAFSPDGLALLDPEKFCHSCPLGREYGHDVAAVVALRQDGRDLGMLGVSFSRDVTADEEEMSLLREVAGDIAFALHSIDLEARRRKAETARQAANEERFERSRLIVESNQLLLDLAGASTERDMRQDVARHLRRITGAAAAFFNEYNPQNQSLVVRGIDLEGGLLDKLVKLLGRRIEAVESPVDDETYQMILGTVVGKRKNLTEMTFGAVPQPVSAVAQRLLGADRFIGLAHIVNGRLFGTSALALRKGQPDPPDDWLESIAHTIAVFLRRRQAEEELWLKNLVFDDSLAANSIADASGVITEANDSFVRIWGYASKDEVVGKTIASFFQNQDEAVAIITALESTGKWEGDFAAKRKDGSAFSAHALATVLRNDREEVAGFQSSVMDITERKRLEGQIAQSDRLASMGMLAAGVAHEINNPLAYVLYNLESLTDDLPKLSSALLKCSNIASERIGNKEWASLMGKDQELLNPAMIEDLRNRFKDALQGSHRIRDVARGLGVFSRVERDRMVPVQLIHVIEVAINMAFNEIKYRAKLVKEYGQTSTVLANDGRLSQVFLNLLINAAHAIEEGDVERNEIRVRTWQESDEVCAEVRDTGSGIAPEHLSHLFEPFFTTKKLGVGTGLGLSISKTIVEEYGGRIEVESAVGKGTRFVVRLPVKKAVEEDEAAQDEAVAQTSVRGRILVVDDEAGIRAAMVRMLRGHDVVQAVSGEEARKILEADQAFDLILCDMMMPAMSGVELHEWLSTTHPDLAKQVVFITGGAFTPKAREHLSKVSNIRIEKPFDVTNFKKIVGDRIIIARQTKKDA
jgi:PAS domain S-box-containing protein